MNTRYLPVNLRYDRHKMQIWERGPLLEQRSVLVAATSSVLHRIFRWDLMPRGVSPRQGVFHYEAELIRVE